MKFDLPAKLDVAQLHSELDALNLGPYCIEWLQDGMNISFECELSAKNEKQVASVVKSHDGSAAIAERAEREAKILAIQLANKALVESAKEKRLSGQQLTQAELSSLVDAMLFPA